MTKILGGSPITIGKQEVVLTLAVARLLAVTSVPLYGLLYLVPDKCR